MRKRIQLHNRKDSIMTFIAKDIEWDIDIDEIYEKIDNMRVEVAAVTLGISKDTYANMTTEERHDFIYDTYHHNRKSADELFNLPETIEIPEEFGITDTEDDMSDVTDWISDEYGFCIKGYAVEEKAA